MTHAVGVWIDHRKAVVVTVTAEGQTTSLIVSRVEKQLGRFAGVRPNTPYESQQVPADDSRERRFSGHLATYYDAVAASLRTADAIFIFGPGEAKGELGRRLARLGRSRCIVGILTADKMTDRQIAATVWQHVLKAQRTPKAGAAVKREPIPGRAPRLARDARPSSPAGSRRRARSGTRTQTP